MKRNTFYTDNSEKSGVMTLGDFGSSAESLDADEIGMECMCEDSGFCPARSGDSVLDDVDDSDIIDYFDDEDKSLNDFDEDCEDFDEVSESADKEAFDSVIGE